MSDKYDIMGAEETKMNIPEHNSKNIQTLLSYMEQEYGYSVEQLDKLELLYNDPENGEQVFVEHWTQEFNLWTDILSQAASILNKGL